MNDSPDEIVRQGYNNIAEIYAAQRDRFQNIRYLERLAALLKPGASVLDVGCGAGGPVDRFLLDHGFAVYGIDVSERQIELARASNPDAAYEVGEMSSLALSAFRVDALVSFYAIFHLPRERHAGVLRTFRSFLSEGGLLLVTMGASEWEGVEPDFHGAEMFWSHFGPKQNRAIVESADFEVLLDEVDRGGDEEHQVILAQAV